MSLLYATLLYYLDNFFLIPVSGVSFILTHRVSPSEEFVFQTVAQLCSSAVYSVQLNSVALAILRGVCGIMVSAAL